MSIVISGRFLRGVTALLGLCVALFSTGFATAAPTDDDPPQIEDPSWASSIRQQIDNDEYAEALAALQKLEARYGKAFQFHTLMAEVYEGKSIDAENEKDEIRWLKRARESYLKAESLAPAKDKSAVRELRELVEADLRDLGAPVKGTAKPAPAKPAPAKPSLGANPAKPANAEAAKPSEPKVTPDAAGGFKVGDKVEAWNGTWHLAEVIEIGSGNYAGHYKVHYDGFSNVSDQYLKADSIRARKAAFKADFSEGPRLAKYSILSYGNIRNPLRLGELELKAGGKYRYAQNGGKLIGEGDYSYDAGTKTVTWKTGPMKDTGWGGGFEIDREGKTHKIRLNRVTIAAHSTDS